MNFGKAILRVLRVIGIIILIPVVLALLVLLIGFVTDLSVTPQWRQAQQESLEYITNLKSHRYQSASLVFVTLDGNAWDYYQRASQLVDSLPSRDKNAIGEMYRAGGSFTQSEVERLVTTYARALALWDSGASCRYCAIPAEYEKGQEMPILKFIPLHYLAKLAVLKGRLELAKENSQGAAETYARVLKMGADISGGEEILITWMVGSVIRDIGVQQMASDLSRFDLASTKFLREAVGQIEGRWPSLDSSLEAESRIFMIPLAKDWDESRTASLLGEAHPNFSSNLLGRLFLSLWSWRSQFSFRKGLLEAVRRQRGFLSAYRAVQNKPWSGITPLLQKTESDIEKEKSSFGFSSSAVLIPPHIIWRAFASRSILRVLKVALAVRESRLSQKRNPEPLDSLLSRDPAVFDLATGKPMRYKIAPDGKTVRLYSVGLNLRDDGGEGLKMLWSKDEVKDDIWIEVP
jgi:hypothetical protein